MKSAILLSGNQLNQPTAVNDLIIASISGSSLSYSGYTFGTAYDMETTIPIYLKK